MGPSSELGLCVWPGVYKSGWKIGNGRRRSAARQIGQDTKLLWQGEKRKVDRGRFALRRG